MLLDVREVTPGRLFPTVLRLLMLTRLTAVLAREEATLPAKEARSPIESRVLWRLSPTPPRWLLDMDEFIALDEERRIWLAGDRDTLWMGAKRP